MRTFVGMRTANPTLNARALQTVPSTAAVAAAMSIQGTVNKTGLLLLLLVLSAAWTWNLYATSGVAATTPWMMGGLAGGLVVAVITVFKKNWSAVTAPLYGLLEGLLLGGLSAVFEQQYPGIVIQAVTLTFGTLACLLMAYTSRWIKVTENFRLMVVSATGAVVLVYAASFVLGLFGLRVPFIHESGLLGIGFSLLVVTVAALNLVLDFDFIEQGASRRLPGYMEWYAAFGLMVTLVWLYIEFLRLLAKLRGRR